MSALAFTIAVLGPSGLRLSPENGGAEATGPDRPVAVALGVVGVTEIASGIRSLGVVSAVAEAGVLGTFAAVAPWIVLAVVAKTGIDIVGGAMQPASDEAILDARAIAAMHDVFDAVAGGRLTFADARQQMRSFYSGGVLTIDEYAAGLRSLHDAEALSLQPPIMEPATGGSGR